jgi:hypothetical protein
MASFKLNDRTEESQFEARLDHFVTVLRQLRLNEVSHVLLPLRPLCYI